jgi:hypothetical protein
MEVAKLIKPAMGTGINGAKKETVRLLMVVMKRITKNFG